MRPCTSPRSSGAAWSPRRSSTASTCWSRTAAWWSRSRFRCPDSMTPTWERGSRRSQTTASLRSQGCWASPPQETGVETSKSAQGGRIRAPREAGRHGRPRATLPRTGGTGGSGLTGRRRVGSPVLRRPRRPRRSRVRAAPCAGSASGTAPAP